MQQHTSYVRTVQCSYRDRNEQNHFHRGKNSRWCGVSLLAIYKLKCVFVDSYGDFFWCCRCCFPFSSVCLCGSACEPVSRADGSLLRFSPLLSWARCDLLRNRVHCAVYFVHTPPPPRCVNAFCVVSIDRISRIPSHIYVVAGVKKLLFIFCILLSHHFLLGASVCCGLFLLLESFFLVFISIIVWTNRTNWHFHSENKRKIRRMIVSAPDRTLFSTLINCIIILLNCALADSSLLFLLLIKLFIHELSTSLARPPTPIVPLGARASNLFLCHTPLQTTAFLMKY